MELTQQIVRDLFDYDPITGILTNKIRRGARALEGSICGNKSSSGHLKTKIDQVDHLCHRIAFLHYHGYLPIEVDHKNLKRTDNRIKNLRAAQPWQNRCNTKIPKNNKSGIKGVSWNKEMGKWYAKGRTKGKQECLGHFDDIEDARKAVEDYRNLMHGEFANHG